MSVSVMPSIPLTAEPPPFNEIIANQINLYALGMSPCGSPSNLTSKCRSDFYSSSELKSLIFTLSRINVIIVKLATKPHVT